MAPNLPPRSSTRRPPRPRPIRLTERETEVAAWLGEDLSLPRIGQKLGVTHHAIRKHLQNIESKLGVHTRPAAVARLLLRGFMVVQSGLV